MMPLSRFSRPAALLLAGAVLAAPALAAQTDDPLAPLPTAPSTSEPAPAPPASRSPAPRPAPRRPLPAGEDAPIIVRGTLPAPPPMAAPLKIPTDWRGVFEAIDASDWAGAMAGIARLPDGPLKPLARAELYTARNSPRADPAALVALLAEAPDLPQAAQIARLAQGRVAGPLPALPSARRMVFLGSSARRQRPDPVRGDPAADALRLALDPLVRSDDAATAEQKLMESFPLLGAEGRAEAGQRVAWIYYVLGRDGDARRVADLARAGGSGEWAGQAAWLSGLAAWRSNDCAAAVFAFRDAARLVSDRDLNAAAHFWAARSEQACRRPHQVAPLLRAAARSADNFYGLLARETLGMPTRLAPFTPAQDAAVDRLANVVRAREMTLMGRTRLADELLRHQAAIGPASQHLALIGAAHRLGLYGTQYQLAHYGPSGVAVPPAARFPLAQWSPVGGWRIDPALGLAHSRQESDFRTAVVSPAGAVGLMQLRPGTAQDIARARGTSVSASELAQPLLNLEYGQSHLELLGRQGATQNRLPKIIAAFNAGTVPVARWNAIPGGGDPLLWMESLSYWETRYYVPSVLRNMFVYQGLTGRAQPELNALAQHRWPELPRTR